jgi:hypothetical protein
LPRRALVILTVVLAAAGCRKAQTGPDANYDKASRLYQQLYASQLDDAYGDPKMDEVVALLKMVDQSSVDAEATNTMLGAIQHGREELAKERAARAKLSAAAQVVAATPPPDIDPEKILAASAPDAGPPPDPFGAGAQVSEINNTTGGCLTDNEPFNEKGTNVTGTVYRVVPTSDCASKLPGYVGQAVLVVSGRIYRRIQDPNPPSQPDARTPPDAGPPPAPPDAGRPPAPRPAAPAADQADAGGEYQIVVPGQPQPGAAPPPADQQQ